MASSSTVYEELSFRAGIERPSAIKKQVEREVNDVKGSRRGPLAAVRELPSGARPADAHNRKGHGSGGAAKGEPPSTRSPRPLLVSAALTKSAAVSRRKCFFFDDRRYIQQVLRPPVEWALDHSAAIAANRGARKEGVLFEEAPRTFIYEKGGERDRERERNARAQ
ncbi:hypothetical protein MTO96_044890 [Rhipicephalus appendiculatus]